MKKFKIIISILILILIFFIWKDYKKINPNYVNYPLITYDIKNINTNFIRKFFISLDKLIETSLIKFSSNHRNYWKIENPSKRETLPKYKYLETEKNPTINLYKNKENFKNWPRSHGNNYSNRFSGLTKINNSNGQNLEVAWIYYSKHENKDIQCNPIVVDGVIFTPVSGGYITAINGETGKEIWQSKKFGSFVAKRGLVYWPGDSNNSPRLYFSNRENLIALDAITGKLEKKFGNNGIIKRTGLNVITPIIYKKSIVIATWDKSLEVYNLLNGKTEWKYKYKKNNIKRHGGKTYRDEGANPWGGMSADIKRGIVYIGTGNPHAYYDGTRRPGKNQGSNSVIAIDLNHKKELWSFQEVSHDLWNSDIASPPILTTIKKDSKLIDVVVAPTKTGNTLILDRLSGKPIFEYRMRKAPVGKISGEKTSAYQPDLRLPMPFLDKSFNIEKIWFRDKNRKKQFLKKIDNFNFGFFEPHELGKKNIQIGGGASWPGASINPDKNIMYVSSSRVTVATEVKKKIEKNKNLGPTYFSIQKRILDDDTYPIIEPPWGTLTAINLNSGKIVWQEPLGEYEDLKNNGFKKTGTENYGGVTSTRGNIVIATGSLDKKIYIYNSLNGEIIWDYKMPFIGSAPPTTYLANNKQFIVVHSTGGRSLKGGYPKLVEFGNALVGFKLKDSE